MKYTKIILCGKRCTGKTTLFWDLQKTLNWPMFSVSEYLRDYIYRFRLSAQEVEAKSSEVSSEIDSRLAKLIQTADQVIVDARVYEGQFRDLPGVASILLFTRDEIRIQRAAYREKSTPEKQAAKLIKRENEWISRMKQIYGDKDFFKPDNYTFAIDTSELTTKQVLEKTISLLNQE